MSLSLQADTEEANRLMGRLELGTESDAELRKLTAINVSRLLMDHGSLGVYARNELGLSSVVSVRQAQAAMASATSSAVGEAQPQGVAPVVSESSIVFGSRTCPCFSSPRRS